MTITVCCVKCVNVPEAVMLDCEWLCKAGFLVAKYIKFNTSRSIRTLQVGGTDEPGLYKGDFFSFLV